MRSRHGAFAATVASAVTTFAVIEPAGSRPRWLTVRRGRFQPVPQAATFVAPFIGPGGRRSRLTPVRRGQFQPLPQAATQSASPFVEPCGPRSRAPFLRRGRFLSVPPVVITTGIGPVVSPLIEPAGPRARTYTPRRGTFYQVPLVGLAPTAPVSPPGFVVSNRPTPLPTHRGLTRWIPPAVQGVPDQINPTRASLCPTRRGRLLWTPPTQPAVATPWVPDPLSPNRTVRPTLVRRGRFWVLAPAPVVAPSTTVVDRMRSRRPAVPPTRRGNVLDIWTAAKPGFVCQDFATAVSVVADSASLTIDAYAGTVSVIAYSAAVSIDAYSGTATNCGR
jgi:hypothetical protein